MQVPIPYGKQHITEDDLAAVRETLLSDYLTQGPKIIEFEKDVTFEAFLRHLKTHKFVQQGFFFLPTSMTN